MFFFPYLFIKGGYYLKLIWQYLKKHPQLLFLDLFGAMMFVVVNLGLPTILSFIIDQAIVPKDIPRLYYWLIVMGVVIILGMLGRIVLIYAASKLTTTMVKDIRNDLFDKIQQFSHQEYETIGVSSLVTRVTSDAFVLMQFTDQMLRVGMITPIMMISSLIAVLMTNRSLAWIILLAMPFVGLAVFVIARKSHPLSQKQQSNLDLLNQYGRENLTGLRVIRAFAREEYQEHKFDEANQSYAGVSSRLFKLMGTALPAFLHIFFWMLIAIIWFALKPLADGTLLVGNLVAFVQYSFHALFSFMLLANLFIIYPKTSVSAERLQEIFDMPISIDMNESGIKETQTQGYLEFDNVTFAYPGETENPVLENINFKAKPGEIVAFIGSTGSGKSTLVQLIPRFYDVTLGRIILDGVDLRDYNLKALRRKIGFVPQKSLLFTGTIGDNLRFGKYNAEERELEHASDISQSRDFIEKSQKRFQTYLEESGGNLSGGQRQRLSIARALVKKPAVYIFDDSFSALDYQTDKQLRRRLKEVTHDATVLIVAQRVTSIMNADQIIVLDKGKIVGRGTHEELMASNEIYQEIAYSQIKEEE